MAAPVVGLSALDLCAGEAIATGSTGEVRLRSAENPAGPPKSAMEAARKEIASAHRYPRKRVTELREKIAGINGLTADHVIIGAGSIELMINTGLWYGRQGRAVLTGDPTWSTTAKYAEASGGEWLRVPLTHDYHYDFDRMRSAMSDRVDLVYLCHPNNPTGIAEDHDTLLAYVEEVAKTRVVMVDEAFIDCLEGAEELSMKKLLPANKNVVIARTFSKLWGMAGFRVGYMMGDPTLLAQLESTVPTLEMQSSIAAAAAIAAIDDHEYIAAGRRNMRAAQKTIYRILDSHQLNYIRTDTNFLSFQVGEPAEAFVDRMRARGVALKPVVVNQGENWVRVSTGSSTELAEFERAMGEVV